MRKYNIYFIDIQHFRKQAMSDTVPLSLLFKCSPGFRSQTAKSLSC